MKTYLLRNMPDELYARMRHAAIDRGCTVRELVIMAIEAFLFGGEK